MNDSYNSQSIVRFRGKSHVIYRRSGKRGSPYSVRLQVEGKRRVLSTGTADVTLAKARAKNLIAEVLDGRWVKSSTDTDLQKGMPTIGACVDEFLEGDQHVRSATATSYVNSLFLILKDVKSLSRDQARSKKVDILTDVLIRDFQAKRQDRKNVTFVEPLKVNTTINSNVRQARSVFSRRALANYEKAGMIIPPTVDKFLKAPGLKEVSHRYSDNPIPQKQIDDMNKALPALKEQDERLWAIHLMIRLMGMRDSEIASAKKDWIIERNGKSFLVINRREGEFSPKRSDGEIPVPTALLDWFDGQDGDFLIPAKHKTARYDLIYRDHNKFVRSHIKDRQKGNHELRKWSGSVVAQKTNSYERAAQFLRIDIETAKAHYLSFTSPPEALMLEDL